MTGNAATALPVGAGNPVMPLTWSFLLGQGGQVWHLAAREPRSGTLTRSSASHSPAVFVAHGSPRPWRDRTRRAGQASRTHAAPRGKRVVATRAGPVGQRAARSAVAVREMSSLRRLGASSASAGMPGRVPVRSRTELDCIGCQRPHLHRQIPALPDVVEAVGDRHAAAKRNLAGRRQVAPGEFVYGLGTCIRSGRVTPISPLKWPFQRCCSAVPGAHASMRLMLDRKTASWISADTR